MRRNKKEEMKREKGKERHQSPTKKYNKTFPLGLAIDERAFGLGQERHKKN